MPRSAEHCDRLGNSMMPIRPSGYCAILHAGSTTRRLGSPPASLKDSQRIWPLPAPHRPRLSLPTPLRRSLACTNAIENMLGTVRRVSRNVKRWRNAAMALRWTAAGMMEAVKGFRRLKAYRQLPILKAALVAYANKYGTAKELELKVKAA